MTNGPQRQMTPNPALPREEPTKLNQHLVNAFRLADTRPTYPAIRETEGLAALDEKCRTDPDYHASLPAPVRIALGYYRESAARTQKKETN